MPSGSLSLSVSIHKIISRCPWCGAKNDRASNAVPGEVVTPSDGDVSMCFYCGEWAVYDAALPAALAQRKPTDAEFIEIGEDPDCQKLRAAWVQMN